MTISLPIPQTTKKTMEKSFEVTVPAFHEKMINNKYIQAFLTVLRAPVE